MKTLPMRSFLSIASVLALTTLNSAACKPSLLPGTEIEETEETRAIYDVLSAYKDAYEKRDADAVLAMVHKDYFETSGTEDPADDYSYAELSEHIRADFEKSMQLRLDLHLKEIVVEEEVADVIYRYQSRAQVSFPAGEQWITKTDVNKIKMRKEGDSWKFVSGL